MVCIQETLDLDLGGGLSGSWELVCQSSGDASGEHGLCAPWSLGRTGACHLTSFRQSFAARLIRRHVKRSNGYAVAAALLIFSGLALMLVSGLSHTSGPVGLTLLVCGAVLASISSRLYTREKGVGEERSRSTGASHQPPPNAAQ